MRARGHTLSLLPMLATLLVAGPSGCQETPSYRLRWTIEGAESPSVAACAEVGLFQVRALVFALPEAGALNFDSFVRDDRQFACHPSAFDSGGDGGGDGTGTVGGGALPPGEYAVQLRGVDRAGQVWTEGVAATAADNVQEGRDCGDGQLCPAEAPYCVLDRCYDGSAGDPCESDDGCGASLRCNPEGECQVVTGCDHQSDYDRCLDEQLVCDCQRLTVVEEGATVELPPFVLAPPPECDDGIDNDHDGLVDASDPSCTAATSNGTEGLAVGVTELRVELTLLGRNHAASCTSVPLRRLRLAIGEGSAQEIVLEEACRLDAPYVALLQLSEGPAVFTVTGYDGVGTAASPAQPVTHPKTFEVEINGFGGTVSLEVDFASTDFLEPIVGAASVVPNYVSEVGPGGFVRSSCTPPPISFAEPDGPTRGLLQLDRLRVELLNGHFSPLEAPVALPDGTVIDGPTEIACTSSLVTEPLEWGSYAMVVEALSTAGEVCFSNVGAPVLLAPGNATGLFMPRVYGPEGEVPPTCRDCEVDADCGLEDELYCVAGVCQQGCMSSADEADAQCLSDALGDLGFVCLGDVCQRPE